MNSLLSGGVKIAYHLSRAFTDPAYVKSSIDFAMKAAMEIVVEAYVDEAPGDDGDFKAGIQSKRINSLHYAAISTATSDDGENYPLRLYQGTGALKGHPDYGYTTGHVRAGTVAWGIGGIRPNKVADRATEKAEKPYVQKVDLFLMRALKK